MYNVEDKKRIFKTHISSIENFINRFWHIKIESTISIEYWILEYVRHTGNKNIFLANGITCSTA